MTKDNKRAAIERTVNRIVGPNASQAQRDKAKARIVEIVKRRDRK